MYRLYALRTDDWKDNAYRFSYYSSRKKYCLVFTDGEQPEKSIDIKDEDMGLLKDDDKMWLLECALVLNKEYAQENEEQMRKERDAFFTEFAAKVEEILKEKANGESKENTSES